MESAYSSGNKAITALTLKSFIEKNRYGFCQRRFIEKLWAEKRTYILIFSGCVYDDSLGKKILGISTVDI